MTAIRKLTSSGTCYTIELLRRRAAVATWLSKPISAVICLTFIGCSTMVGTPPDESLRVAAPKQHGWAVKGDAVWGVVDAGGRGAIVRSDRRTWEGSALIPLDIRPGVEGYGDWTTLRLGEGSVWVGVDNNSLFAKTENRYRIYKISMDSNRIIDTIRLPSERHFRHLDLAVNEDAVWVANGDRRIFRVDPTTSEVTVIPLDHNANDIKTGNGYVWAKQFTDDLVSKIDPRTREVTAIRLGYEFELWNLFFHESSGWVSSYHGDIISQIDTKTNEVKKRIDLSKGINIDGDTYQRNLIFNGTYHDTNSLWLLLRSSQKGVILAKFDLQRGQITSKVELGETKPFSESRSGKSLVFVTQDENGWWGFVMVDLATGAVARKYRLSHGNLIPHPLDFKDNIVWFTVHGHGIYRVALDE